MDLRLDPDDLNKCVQCGLCLPSCPTFRVTGDESRSPRGRIALLRQVQDHDAPVTAEVMESFETCVQCRGCEPACPSAVPYGQLMERARETLAGKRMLAPWWQRIGLEALTRPRLLRFGSIGLAAAQRLGAVPSHLGLPDRLPLRRSRLAATADRARSGDEAIDDDTVRLFTGCVMDAWQRDVHQAAQRVLEAAGFSVIPTGTSAPCCGALHTHAGLGARARRLAQDVIVGLGLDAPIAVDSAGCGAAMKDYGHLLGTPSAERFAEQVYDIHELVATRIERLPVVAPLDLRVGIQDPCHLRHVQNAHHLTRTVLAPFVTDLVELDDQGMCCGAGGAYSVLEPALASDIRERKLDAIDRADVDIVVSANPGCSLHLSAAGVATTHPLQLVDRALAGGRDLTRAS